MRSLISLLPNRRPGTVVSAGQMREEHRAHRGFLTGWHPWWKEKEEMCCRVKSDEGEDDATSKLAGNGIGVRIARRSKRHTPPRTPVTGYTTTGYS